VPQLTTELILSASLARLTNDPEPSSPTSSSEGSIVMRWTAVDRSDRSLRANLAQVCRVPSPRIQNNGDSIEVVRQEGASKNHRGIEALVNARQERPEDGDASKAKELDEGHRPIRHTEIHRQTGRYANHHEAVAGHAYQARSDHRAPPGSICGQTGCSGRRRARRKREGPRHHLTTVRQRRAHAGRLEPSRVSLTTRAAPRNETGRSTRRQSP
jgi:hypothetical protein